MSILRLIRPVAVLVRRSPRPYPRAVTYWAYGARVQSLELWVSDALLSGLPLASPSRCYIEGYLERVRGAQS